MSNDLKLNLQVKADTKEARENLQGVNTDVQQVGDSTAETNKKSLSDWINTINSAADATVGLWDKTKGLVSSYIGIDAAKRSVTSFLVNATAGFLKLREAISQEKEFSQAARTIEGTAEQLQGLKKEIQDLSTSDLAVPVEQLYAVAGAAGAMGKSVENIPQFVRTVSEAAVALDISAEDLAQQLGTVQSLLGLSEDALVSFTDQVNTTADTLPGKVQELDIINVLSTGAATAGKNFGLLRGETVALSGTLLALGSAPEVARTSIKNLLNTLQNAKNQTPDFQDGLAAIGTSADKLAADIKAKPLPTLLHLLDTMHGLSNAAKLDIATKLLGNSDDKIALVTLVDNVDLLKSAIKNATDAEIYAGSVHKAYKEQITTTSAKIDLLWSAIKVASESLVTTFLPAVQWATDGLRSLVTGFNEFSRNHPIIRTMIEVSGTIISLGGVFRLLTVIMLGVTRVFPALQAGFSIFIGPLLTTRLAALSASFATLRTSILASAGASGGFATAMVAIRAAAAATLTSLGTLISTYGVVGALGRGLLLLFGGPIGLAVGALALIGIGVANLKDKIVTLGDTETTVGDIFSATLTVIGNQFRDAKEDVDSFSESVDKAKDSGEHLNSQAKVWGDTLNNAIGIFVFLAHAAGDAVAALLVQVETTWNTITDIMSGKGFIDSIKKGWAQNLANAGNFVESIKQEFIDSIGMKKDYTTTLTATVETQVKKDKQAKAAAPDERAPDNGADLPANGATASSPAEQAKAQAAMVKEIRDREIQEIKANEEEKIRLYTATGASQAKIDAFVFEQKKITRTELSNLIEKQLTDELVKENKAAQDKKVLSADELTAKKTTYQDIEKTYQGMISDLIAEEQRLMTESKRLADERKGIEQGVSAFVREMHQADLTSEEKLAEDKQRLSDLVAARDKAKAAGDVEAVADLNKQIYDLGKDVARQQQAAVKAGTGYKSDVLDTVKIVQTAADGLLKTNANAQTANAKRLQEVRDEAANAKTALDDVQTTIKNLNTELGKNTTSTHTVKPDTTDAVNKINDLKKDTFSTHTVHITEVKDGAAPQDLPSIGSMAAAYADGGEVFKRKQGAVHGPGTSTSDSIPAMLSDGEYVVNAAAVRKHGVDKLDSINNGDGKIAAYANGGPVGNVDDPRIQERAKQLEDSAYQSVKQTWDDPRMSVLMRMQEGQTTMPTPEVQEQNFVRAANIFLQGHGMPPEFLQRYLAEKDFQKQMTNNDQLSFEDRARAAIALEDQFNGKPGSSGSSGAQPQAPGAGTQLKFVDLSSPAKPKEAVVGSSSLAKFTQPITPKGFIPRLPGGNQPDASSQSGPGLNQSSSSRMQPGAGGREVWVHFTPPNGGSPGTLRGSQADVDKVLRTLEEASKRGLTV